MENNQNEFAIANENEKTVSKDATYVDVSPNFAFATNVRSELHKVIIGMDDTINFLIVGLLTNGHVLLEGVPGIAKTLLVKLLSKVLSIDFKRIQFTPDLMPSDILGTNIYNMQTANFLFRKGPVFSNIILADEINRSPAKTQSALLEAMEERQITIEGVTHQMNYPFYVIATQNPIEQEGTYRLPEAQLDRFLFKINMDYPSIEEELQILTRFQSDFFNKAGDEVNTVFSGKDMQLFCSIAGKVFIKNELLDYISKIIHNTRHNSNLYFGASPRAGIAIVRSAKALASISGRDFVTPDDIQKVAYPVLNHRIILTPEREIEGVDANDIIKSILTHIEVPR